MTGVVLTAALLLAAVLTVLAAPHVLARWRWLRAAPGEALFLWQAVSLAGVAFALLAAPVAALQLGTDRPLLLGAACLLSGVMLVRLLLSGHRVGTDLRRLRAEHRTLVDLVGERIDPPRARAEGVAVLARGNPTVYCLPGRHDRIVLSQGAVDRLTPDELDAVLAHEQAHLDQRHDLLLELFTVLHETVPARLRADEALREVHLLAEMLADRAASRKVGNVPLARALVAMATGGADREGTPAGALGSTATGGAQVAIRLRAFAADLPHPALRLLIVSAGLLMLALPLVTLAQALWRASQIL